MNVGNLKVDVARRADASPTRSSAACVATTFVYVDAPPTPPAGRARARAPAAGSRLDEGPRPSRLLARGRAAVAAACRPGAGTAAPHRRATGAGAGAGAPATDTIKSIVDQELEPDPTGYSYNPQGRRDPFVSLLKPCPADQGARTRRPGMEGFLIQEVALKGIVRTPKGYIAMLLGTDGKSYFVKVGQRLFDGVDHRDRRHRR